MAVNEAEVKLLLPVLKVAFEVLNTAKTIDFILVFNVFFDEVSKNITSHLKFSFFQKHMPSFLPYLHGKITNGLIIHLILFFHSKLIHLGP